MCKGYLRSGKAFPSDATCSCMAEGSWSFSTSAILVRISFNQSSFDPCEDKAVPSAQSTAGIYRNLSFVVSLGWVFTPVVNHSAVSSVKHFSFCQIQYAAVSPYWRINRANSLRCLSRSRRPSAAAPCPSVWSLLSGASSNILLSLPGASGQSASEISPVITSGIVV